MSAGETHTSYYEKLEQAAQDYRESGGRRHDQNEQRKPAEKLSPEHQWELYEQSGISGEVVAARGYETLYRRSKGDNSQRERLRKLHMPTWSFKEDWNFPGH